MAEDGQWCETATTGCKALLSGALLNDIDDTMVSMLAASTWAQPKAQKSSSHDSSCADTKIRISLNRKPDHSLLATMSVLTALIMLHGPDERN